MRSQIMKDFKNNNQYDTYLKIFVNNLNLILCQRNLSNTDFIKYCKISVGYFYRILKHENAGFVYYVKIAEALNLSLYRLFYDESLCKEIRIEGIVPNKYHDILSLKTIINSSDNNFYRNIYIEDDLIQESCDIYLDYMVNEIKKCLNERKISQSQFAKKIGITHAYINNVINRKQVPSIGILIDIATSLDVPLFDLLNVPEKQQLGVPENYKRCLFRVTSII